jgi:hypothetical protein
VDTDSPIVALRRLQDEMVYGVDGVYGKPLAVA